MDDDGEVEALRSLISLPRSGSPSNISLACFKQEEQTKLMFIYFSNGTGSALENSLYSGYPFASVPARCRKTTNLTFLSIAIDANGFRRMKEGEIYKILPQIFSFLPRDLVMIFQSLVMILPPSFRL